MDLKIKGWEVRLFRLREREWKVKDNEEKVYKSL